MKFSKQGRKTTVQRFKGKNFEQKGVGQAMVLKSSHPKLFSAPLK